MSFRPQTYAQALAKKKAREPKARKPMKKTGKRTDAWTIARGHLKIAFERAGIMTCELRMEGCWHDNALSFAHSKKRRHIEGNELYEVILCCSTNCHPIIERMPKAEMHRIVLETIANRPYPVTLE